MASVCDSKVSRYRDEIHGDVILDPVAVSLINTAPLQRLGRIYQLGYTHLVYRGATHTRLSHVIGAYHMAGRFVDCLRDNYRLMAHLPPGAVKPEHFLPQGPGAERSASSENRWLVLRYLVQWAALLHDVGHIPLGHTLEDEFEGIYVGHDHFRSPRLPAIWRGIRDKRSELEQVFADAESSGILPTELSSVGINASLAYAIVMCICLYKEKREPGAHADKYRSFEVLLNEALADTSDDALTTAQREFVLHVQLTLQNVRTAFFPYMVDIVANTICADYMDYVRRDTANAGLDRQTDDRVLSQFLIGQHRVSEANLQYRMALLLTDSRGKPRLDACTGVVDLVRRRFRLAEIIYYHKTKVSASAMLAKAMNLIGQPPEVPTEASPLMRLADTQETVAKIRSGELTVRDLKERQAASALLSPEIGDESLLLWLQDRAWSRAEKLDPATSVQASAELEALFRGIGLLQLLVRRQLYKVCAQINAEGVAYITGVNSVDGEGNPEQIKQKIQEVIRLRGKADSRAAIERAIADAAGWPVDSFLIYVPERKSQAKGIETRALSAGSVVTLGEHPAVSAEVQTLNRHYERLWRVILLIHPDYQHDDLGLSRAVDTFLQAVWKVDLGSCESHVKNIARFNYIPEPQRDGAELFRELCDIARPRWALYSSALDTLRKETTPSSREQAYRAYILSLNPNPGDMVQRLKDRCPDPGDIEQRVAHVARSDSPSLAAQRTALKSIYEALQSTAQTGTVLPELSEKAFDSQCRAIFRFYVPEAEKGQLRPGYREFITRNRKRSGRGRYLVVQHLKQYDLSGIDGIRTQFNREEDILTETKLRDIERRVDSEEVAA